MITICEKCGGISSYTDPKMLAGKACKCPVITEFVITSDDLFEIHNLATRVIQSRQNVGTMMRLNAETVLKIIRRVNRRVTVEKP